MFVLST